MANVLRISEAATLALHTLALLAARPGEILSTHKIATRLDASEAHLAKVLQQPTRGLAGRLHHDIEVGRALHRARLS